MGDLTLPYARSVDLPLFERPPITGASLALQFRRLRLKAVNLGDLRKRFADRYPLVDEAAPAPLQVEQFAKRPRTGIEFQVLNRPPLPMVTFMSSDETRLVQVQEDRFVCAWRKVPNSSYPRYQEFREEFVQNSHIFVEFVENLSLGDVEVTQAEISYVNEISGYGDTRPDVLFRAVPSFTTSGRATLSSVSTNQHLTFRNSEGIDYARLHVAAEPIRNDEDPVLRLSLVYRGEPWERTDEPPGLDPLLRFFDDGHDAIVRAFAANTTEAAQRGWGRIQ